MNPSSVATPAQALAAHRTFLQAIARAILLDRETADDIASEAIFIALKGAPRTAPRRWLAVVTRNLAFEKLRNARATARRETAAAHPERTRATDEIVVLEETRAAVVEAVLQLDEPYRTAVLLRYYDFLPPREIARKLQIPVETARTRIKRGLLTIRARLEKKYPASGGRLNAALLPFATAKTNITIPAFWMGAGAKWTAAVAVILLFTLLIWTIAPFGGNPVETGPSLALTPASAPAPDPTDTIQIPPESRATSPSEPPPKQPINAEVICTFDGRVVDSARRPVAGAEIYKLMKTSLLTKTDADGHFTFQAASRESSWAEPSWYLQFKAAGFATVEFPTRLLPNERVHLGEIKLSAGGSASGKVTNPRGEGVAHCILSINDGGTDLFDEVITNADGSFRIDNIMPGRRPLSLYAPGTRTFFNTVFIFVKPGEETKNIHLLFAPPPPERAIFGRVFDPSGKPVPEAKLVIYSGDDPSTAMFSIVERAGGEGQFTITPAETPASIFAFDPRGQFRPVLTTGIEPSANEVILQLGAKKELTLSVSSADSKPIAKYTAWTVDARRERRLSGSAVARQHYEPPGPDADVFASTVAHPDGVTKLTLPIQPFRIVVKAAGFALAEEGPFEPDAEIQNYKIQLKPLSGIRGTVVSGGRPVVNAKIIARRAGAGSVIERFSSHVTHWIEYITFTGADGGFAMDIEQNNIYYLRAEASGLAPSEAGPLDYNSAAGISNLQIQLGSGGALRGRVTRRDGSPAAGAIVAISNGDGTPFSKRADAAGNYQFEHLTPGKWRAELRKREIAGPQNIMIGIHTIAALENNILIEEGRETRFDLIQYDPVELRGKITLGSRAPRDAFITLSPSAPGSTGRQVEIEAGGSFVTSVDEPGDYKIQLHCRNPADQFPDITDQLRIGDSSVEWNIYIPCGSIEGTILPFDPQFQQKAWVTYRWTAGANQKLQISGNATIGSDGKFTIPTIAEGSVRVGVWPQGYGVNLPNKKEDVTVNAGNATKVIFNFP